MAAELSVDQCELSSTGSPQQLPEPGHKSWDTLRQNVRQRRKLLFTLARGVPGSFTFRVGQTALGPRMRLYFLAIPDKCRENTLLYVNVPNEVNENVPVLEWKNLLDDFQPNLPSAQLSREEQLLRERKRLGIFGITSYDVLESEGKFIFPACNNMFVGVDHNISIDDPILPQPINTSCSGARLDPKMCPDNSNIIAFIHQNDIWVTNLMSGQECRLTFAHEGLNSLSSDPLSAGVPSFVVQEEFDRYTGYWWEPSVIMSSHRKRRYRILYEEVDETDVEILNIYAPMSTTQSVDEYRYPRAGTPNAKSILKLVEFEVGDDGQIQENFVEKQMYIPLNYFFPWMEYLVRAGWTPDSNYVYAQIMDRQQSRLVLVLIPLDCFVPISTDADIEMSSLDSSSYPPLQVLYEDTSDIWVNVHDILHFFPQSKESEVSFIWSSEKTGYRHLYCVTSKLNSCDNTNMSAMDLINEQENFLKPVVINEVPLTSGNWEVLGKQIWVDESRGLVYFNGLKDSPIESQLYVVSYLVPSNPIRLTELGYSHSVSFSKDCSVFVTVYSSVKQSPLGCINRICHKDDGNVSTQTLGILLTGSDCPDYNSPDLFDFDSSSGHKMYGLVYKPEGFEPRIKYPTVLMVYGGPQVQQVTNSFKGVRFLRHHTLASQGYVVVVIDGRGSCNRGLQFEGHIKKRLGTVELDDQLEGLHWLAAKVDYIDLNRVAIHGWSYGGYLSLLGLAQKSDIFKVAIAGAPVASWNLYDTGYTERYMDVPDRNLVAIAGAPVVSWNLYDTGYTERYMDVPDRNLEGYQNGSVLQYVQNFPDEENRLLIIHGLIDENVHFHHTSLLVNALVKACKPYSLQVYPNERHGIRNHEASEHYKTMILSFLQQHL